MGQKDHTQIGIGCTVRDAARSLESTAIQSTGRDCGIGDTLEWAVSSGWIFEWAVSAGWIDDADKLKPIDDIDDVLLEDK